MDQPPGFMMDVRRYTKTALDVHGKLNIRLKPHPTENDTWVGYIEDPRRADDDDIGALYYVVAVILIYGLSIVMMIASHIRKNKQDNQLRTYLKEMAKLRKNDRREKVLCKMTDLANRKKKQEELEAKRELQQKLKDTAVDSEAESEVCQPLMKKDTNEDNTDSVFLPPDYCISPGHPKPDTSDDKQSDTSSVREPSISSRSSLRNNNSTGSFSLTNSNVPSDSFSPSLSEYRYYSDRIAPGRVRSPSFHDYRRWKRAEYRAMSLQDYKSGRLHDKLSPSPSEQRSILSPSGSRSPSLSEFRMSPLCGRERSLTVHETRPARWTKTKTPSPNDVKFHTISETNQNKKLNDFKLTLPAKFHAVDEDAVL